MKKISTQNEADLGAARLRLNIRARDINVLNSKITQLENEIYSKTMELIICDI